MKSLINFDGIKVHKLYFKYNLLKNLVNDLNPDFW